MDLRVIPLRSVTARALPAGVLLVAQTGTPPSWIMIGVGFLVLGISLGSLYLVGWASKHRRHLGADDQLPGAPDRTHYQGPPPPS
ncbi:hypothetical protein TR74_12950 [Carbonactinospora thermoautotrophica]|uniref:Uncharacterized protein n=1 Tax=Carbonactinospora thermoautotrophica TaxID=1469144 RepID=A0A132NFV5_9ACTN|nr:hypothetical protein [Carbonactinospora thermoautotrophica]KWX08876.1 hypothetical protein TR74_12950 [Carbonactinospora thermoautotrophica]